MDRSDDYRQKAQEADEAAARALSPIERDSWAKIAEEYRQLGREAEATKKRGV